MKKFKNFSFFRLSAIFFGILITATCSIIVTVFHDSMSKWLIVADLIFIMYTLFFVYSVFTSEDF